MSFKSITNKGSICLKVTKNNLSFMNLDDWKFSSFANQVKDDVRFKSLSKTNKFVALSGYHELVIILKFELYSSILY